MSANLKFDEMDGAFQKVFAALWELQQVCEQHKEWALARETEAIGTTYLQRATAFKNLRTSAKSAENKVSFFDGSYGVKP